MSPSMPGSESFAKYHQQPKQVSRFGPQCGTIAGMMKKIPTTSATNADVLILGAGMAGLATAAELSAAGQRVIILEARDRIGGRVHTVGAPKPRSAKSFLPIELGAEFIHGRPRALLKLTRDAKLELRRFGTSHWHWDDGRKGYATRSPYWQKVDGIMEELADFPERPDLSFTEFLATRRSIHPHDLEAERMARSFVEGFHAAPADDISAASLLIETRNGPDSSRNFRVREGYARVAEHLRDRALAHGAKLLLNTVARKVCWRVGHVEAGAQSQGRRQTHTARRLIITVPIGVLKIPRGHAGHIAFDPPLPPTTLRALDRIAMSSVVKVRFRFKPAFWRSHIIPSRARKKLRDVTFLHAPHLPFPTWWTHYPDSDPILTGWSGGPAADKLSKLTDQQIIRIGGESLTGLLMPTSYQAPLLQFIEEAHVANWQRDPFSRGAYSYLRVGSEGAREVLASPIADTIHISGEAAAPTGQDATVAGALEAGRRTAEMILAGCHRK
ncbi:FAD-dependent oxidoreductase [Candidatus Sumerlaeota bacterium]|nr:FAD-dependent oxidoreductase [Candidatus Sumerlaeota bacterium]